MEPKDINNRGKSVLDVAIQRRNTSASKPSADDFDAPRTLGDGSRNNEEVDIGIPVRLGINSPLLRIQLLNITSQHMGDEVNIILPPWKSIVTYYKEIKKRFEELEKLATEEVTRKMSKEMEPVVNTTEGQETGSPKEEKKVEKRDYQEDNESTISICESCRQKHKVRLECLPDVVKHFRCLVDFIDNDLKHVFELRRGLADGTIQAVAHGDLWHLFSPGDLVVIAKSRGDERFFQGANVMYTSGGRPRLNRSLKFEKIPVMTPFRIFCYSMAFGKTQVGPLDWALSINFYNGRRPITSLEFERPSSPNVGWVFPIRFLDNYKTVVADLIKRAKRLRELTPFSHKRYCGLSSGNHPEYLNSHIIIDLEQRTPGLSPSSNAFLMSSGVMRMNFREIAEGCPHFLSDFSPFEYPGCHCWDVTEDSGVDEDRATKYKNDLHLHSLRDLKDGDLTDDFLVLFPPTIDAFVLRERDFFDIHVDLVKDLDGEHGDSLKELKRNSGFEDLVLPEGHKDLVEALVRAHKTTRKPKDDKKKVRVDLIDGKGEGLIILLHGVPGVGKTSTAECVAAYTRRPLYPITCANIGLEPNVVEENLTGPDGHFRRAQQWNYIVLLDEADVFLAKREARDNDAKRNALVSVFLRTLEYYPGILILTTNRVGSFDEAFVSRIQVFLYYPPLDEDKTIKVWQVNVNRMRVGGILNIDYEDEAMIMEFAKEQYVKGRRWNGRQIRNFFQTAVSLAESDNLKWHLRAIENGQVEKGSKPGKPRLTTRTLKIVAGATGKFIDYINATLPSGSHAAQQTDEGTRNDEWQDKMAKNE